jgi:hypothetical protein
MDIVQIRYLIEMTHVKPTDHFVSMMLSVNSLSSPELDILYMYIEGLLIQKKESMRNYLKKKGIDDGYEHDELIG